MDTRIVVMLMWSCRGGCAKVDCVLRTTLLTPQALVKVSPNKHFVSSMNGRRPVSPVDAVPPTVGKSEPPASSPVEPKTMLHQVMATA